MGPAGGVLTDKQEDKVMIGGLIGLGVVAVIVLAVIGIYNRLVTLRNRYRNAFSQIDVQLQRRYDLIPNLVETAKGYMKHERETLDAVITARNQAAVAMRAASQNPGNPQAMQGLMAAETGLTGVLGRMFALAESYPDLKANQTMAQLMEEMASTENRVSFARQAYNDAVMVYNTGRETFPAVIFAGMFGFDAAALFELKNEAAREAPQVKF